MNLNNILSKNNHFERDLNIDSALGIDLLIAGLKNVNRRKRLYRQEFIPCDRIEHFRPRSRLSLERRRLHSTMYPAHINT